MSAPPELELLRERARQLAQPAATLGLSDSAADLLLFSRGGRSYALDIRFVRELAPLSEYERIPGAPPACLGLCALRGELIAVFDLATLTDRGPAPERGPRLLLLCGDPAQELGLAVDEATSLVAPGALRSVGEDETTPIMGLDERGFFVLDGEALLNDPRLKIDPQRPESAP